MAGKILLYVVPIKPNSKKWIEPDFEKLGKGFPSLWGYGHEEWNNSPLNDFKEKGLIWHAFHTQGDFGEINKERSVVFLFLGSRNGLFVGLGRNPIECGKEKQKIAKLTHLRERGTKLLYGVKKCIPNMTDKKFWSHWNSSDGWKNGFRWKTERKDFIWFDTPIQISAKKIIGKKLWGFHYNRPKLLNDNESKKIIDIICNKLKNLKEFVNVNRTIVDMYENDFEAEVSKYVRKGEHLKNVKGQLHPKKRTSVVDSFERDPTVAAETLIRAKGVCGRCHNPAPFCKKDGTPYLEVHHIIPLKMKGADILANTIALCPNCHREVHYGQKKKNERI